MTTRLDLEHCARCGRAAHATETNDEGVCVDCLGSMAVLPDAHAAHCNAPVYRHPCIRERGHDGVHVSEYTFFHHPHLKVIR